MKERSEGFVREEIKRIDEQLQRNLSLRSMQKQKLDDKGMQKQQNLGDKGMQKQQNLEDNEKKKVRFTEKQDWEIDPSKLIIKQVIAPGAFGTVHRGIYDGQDVAVKVLEEQRAKGDIASLRIAFTREVSIWPKLDHPNIAKCLGATLGTSGLKIHTHNKQIDMQSDAAATASVIIEYLPCGTLKSYLRKNRKRKLAFKTVVRMALDLARGLSYLHSLKIVHRDIKTENLLLDKNHTLKIIDFDVACLEASNPNEMTARIGTLGYMAPEVLESKPYNRKCDVYSFGICLWEIYCCDVAPYPNVILSDRSSTVVYQNIIPEIPKCCPSSLAEIMSKCWDANPNNRPEMEEVVIMLKAIDTSKGKGMKTLYGPLGCLLFCR
ncbi:hypothetical protein RGQ29_015570 [Quercus rubra]|uniref:Protein kinase domain-containing protein n=1 Tax=Quercus rubra TaxID=3512 RepID=A0AAN7FPS5_QUERU|nr:hypothetical protein RGQ29_015570 [Quercus rubra]